MTEVSIIANRIVFPAIITLTLIAVYTDCRWRIIKNSLTLPAIILGLLLHTLGNGWSGLIFSVFGLVVGAGLMFIPFALGQMGAGDVKLMGALGSLLGGYAVLNVFLYTTIVGGVLALGFAFYHKDMMQTFKKVWLLIKCMFLFRSPATGMALFNRSIPMPYGLAIGVGIATYLLVGKIV